MANYLLGEACYALGDYPQALDFMRKNVESLEGDLVRERFSRLGFGGLPSVFSRSYVVRCCAELGAFAEGIACGEEAIRIAEAVDQSVDLIGAHAAVGALYLRQGELLKAVSMLERSLALLQPRNHPYWFPVIAPPLGAAYALSGRVADALPLLEQAVEQSKAMRIRGGHALQVAWLSEAYVLAERPEDAIQCAERALDFSRTHKERGHQAWVLRLLGEIAAHRDPPDVEKAEVSYRQALALADELGMCPLQAHCHLGLGALYRHSNRLEQVQSALSAAIELFRSMKMSFWLTRARAELAKAE